MLQLLPVILFVSVAVGAIVYGMWAAKRARVMLVQTGSEIGLEEETNPSAFAFLGKSSDMSGRIDGHDCRLYRYTEGHGKNKRTYTRFRCDLTHYCDVTFTVARKRYYHSMLKIVGMKDILTGDSFFDDAFFLRGNNEDVIAGIFGLPEISEKLMHALKMKRINGSVKVKANAVSYTEFGEIMGRGKADRFVEMSGICVLLASALDASAEMLYRERYGKDIPFDAGEDA